jgi:hypothetical protein
VVNATAFERNLAFDENLSRLSYTLFAAEHEAADFEFGAAFQTARRSTQMA